MEDFYDDDDDVEPTETDEDYEFQAPQFYDFTRPEFDYEIEDAERWFQVSGNYPPSPFFIKLNLEKILSVEVVPRSPSKEKCSNTKSIGSISSDSSAKKNGKGKMCATTPQQDKAKVKTNSSDKFLQRSPSFMEPTASNLAKQKANHTHSGHICTRFQKTSAKLEHKGSLSPYGPENPATKRQKLDIGYISKAAQLKHQFLLMHKLSKKKVTVPKEPELETTLRAQRRRSKISIASSESESQKQNCYKFRAHPLNKKILQPRLSPIPKKSPPRLPDFQVFHLKTTERAKHHASAKVYPGITDNDINQVTKQKPTISRESRSSTGAKFLESPPTEQFSKLSLGPDTETSYSSPQSSRRSSLKGQKKSDGDHFQADFWRCNAKPKQCGGHMRLHEAKCWSDVSRSLDIH